MKLSIITTISPVIHSLNEMVTTNSTLSKGSSLMPRWRNKRFNIKAKKSIFTYMEETINSFRSFFKI